MGGTTYLVDIELGVRGNLPGQLGPANQGVGDLRGNLGKLGGELRGLADGFTGVAERVGGVMLGLGKVAGAGVIAATTYGVLGLNKELETTQVSLAAVLNAQGMAPNMGAAMKEAAGWVKQMKQDAKDLPGEFSDLLGIVQSGAGAAFNAGLDVKGFERMAAQGMAAAKAMSVPMDQAGRELAQLLEGRAGGHNVFGTRLGIHSEDFKGKGSAERVKIITEALERFQPAIATFGTTFDAQSSSFVDNMKTFLGSATMPLFEKLKKELAGLNAWFDNNQGQVEYYANEAGKFLTKGFDAGKAVILEYGPAVLEFADNARRKLGDLWDDISPAIKTAGGYLKDFLKDDGSIDKLLTLGKLYLAVKGGGMIADGIGGAMGLGSALGGVAGASGGIGSLGAAASSAAAALGPLVVAAAAVTAGLLVYSEYTSATKEAAQIERDQNTIILENMAQWSSSTGQIDTSSAAFADALDSASSAVSGFASALGTIKGLVGMGSGDARQAAKDQLFADANEFNARQQLAKETRDFVANDASRYIGTMAAGAALAGAQGAKAAEAKKKDQKLAGGKGGTNIGKIEITVSSNQNPGQIARLVATELIAMKRYRLDSPNTRNFSVGR